MMKFYNNRDKTLAISAFIERDEMLEKEEFVIVTAGIGKGLKGEEYYSNEVRFQSKHEANKYFIKIRNNNPTLKPVRIWELRRLRT